MKYIKRFDEVIKVDIKVGDTVLGGRFKNKKTVVKKIGKNKKGDITINGKPLLKYRIIKESLLSEVGYHFSYLEDDGFTIKVYDDDVDTPNISIFKSIGPKLYSYSDMEEFDFELLSDDLHRFLSMMDRSDLSYIYCVKKHGSANGMEKISIDDIFNGVDIGKIIKLVMVFGV